MCVCVCGWVWVWVCVWLCGCILLFIYDLHSQRKESNDDCKELEIFASRSSASDGRIIKEIVNMI